MQKRVSWCVPCVCVHMRARVRVEGGEEERGSKHYVP